MKLFRWSKSESPTEQVELRTLASFDEVRDVTDRNSSLEEALDSFLIWRQALIKEAQEVGGGMTGADHDLIIRRAEALAETFKAKGFIVDPKLFV